MATNYTDDERDEAREMLAEMRRHRYPSLRGIAHDITACGHCGARFWPGLTNLEYRWHRQTAQCQQDEITLALLEQNDPDIPDYDPDESAREALHEQVYQIEGVTGLERG